MTGRRLFTLFFLGLGFWCLAVGASKALEGLAARSWPTAPGRVVISELRQLPTPKRPGVSRLCLRLEYWYEVGGKGYRGTRLNTGWPCFGSRSYLERARRRHPSGARVRVRYNPDDPARSLLEPGVEWSALFLMGVGLCLVSASWPLFRRRGRGRRLTGATT
ncbi:DUF3592 domain-containing protein [Dissulfurirhabdus thermomarina]|uniref:DUF3592 domain-containing protein n=1 Tax=Dissulfurirhabdus thermomarina TaxID=1765737 RepID=A0A6N9TTK3_DISTH|nr:DUF3592 domain-containing protein [Dissulfurirhabdus thermomarina]NDY43074.1 DUF3592 domain-containing protein [Dissulfurirhabdus thermomarina]NMX22387.1 DUF3592 domain-containing protein [Dissulfurirhabdus thermomarina]